MEKHYLLSQLQQAIASGFLGTAELEYSIAQAKTERQEYLRRTPERILHAFSMGEEKESHIKYRRDPKTGEIVIHTSDRFAHAALQSQALRQEHDSGALEFHVGHSKDKSAKQGWHYRISISGKDEKALGRVYKSLQLLSKKHARFEEYGEPVAKAEPPKPVATPSSEEPKPPQPKPVAEPTPQKNGWGWKHSLTSMAATAATGLTTLLFMGKKVPEAAPQPVPVAIAPDAPKEQDMGKAVNNLSTRYWRENRSEVKMSADGRKRLMSAEDLQAEIMQVYGKDIERWHQEYSSGSPNTRGGYKPKSYEDYLSYKLTEATHRDKSKTGWWHQVGGDHPTAHSKPQGRGGR